MILTGTEQIRAYLGGAVTTNQLEWTTAWADHNATAKTFTPDGDQGVTNDTTPVVILDGPGGTAQRQAKQITIFNADTVNATVVVERFSGSARRWVRATLQPNWSLQWEPGGTWHVYDADGVLQLGGVGGGGASAAVTSNAISVISQALSAHSQQISVLSQGLSVLSNTNSSEHAALSLRADSVAQAISVVSNAVSAGDAGLSGRVDSVNAFISSVSARSVGGVSTRGLQSIVDALSNRISGVAGGAGSVTSAEAQAISAQAASALSQALSVLSVTDAALSGRADSAAQAISVLSQQLSLLSQAHSALSQTVSVISTTLSNEISVRSNQHSIALQGISVVSNAASNALSVANAASQAASVVSARLASILTTDLSIHSQAISVLSQQLSIISVNVVSLQSTVSALRSAVSGVSATSLGGGSATGLQAVIDALSNKISGTAAGAQSVTSAEYVSLQSVVSHLASIVSNVSANSAGGSATGLQNVINMLSNKISQAGGGGGSVTSDELSAVSAQAASAISARIPWLAARYLFTSDVQSTTASALTDVSGLVLTVAAGERWELDGMVAISTSAATVGIRMGFSVPPLSTPRWAHFVGICAAQSAAVLGGGGRLQVSGASVILSNTSTVAAGALIPYRVRAIMDVASAGTIRLMYAGIASTVASPIHFLPGSYLKCFRLK